MTDMGMDIAGWPIHGVIPPNLIDPAENGKGEGGYENGDKGFASCFYFTFAYYDDDNNNNSDDDSRVL